MFKTVFIAAAILVVQITASEIGITEQMIEWAKGCAKIVGISEEHMKEMEKMEIGIIDEPKFNDWSACWMQKSEMMDDKGHIDTALLLKITEDMSKDWDDEERVKEFKNTMNACCKEADGISDPAEAAGRLMKCVMKIKQ